MQEHVNNGKRYLLVEVPEGARNVDVDTWTGLESQFLIYKNWDDFVADEPTTIDLPPGQWQLIGLASQLSESEAGEVVAVWDFGGLDRNTGDWIEDFRYKNYATQTYEMSAKESLASLLQPLSLSPHAIILKAI